jgi:hypothetical protein
MTVGRYTLRCREPDCNWEKIVDNNLGAGWQLGMVVPPDNTTPEKAKCHLCKTHNMVVVSVPFTDVTRPPKGFIRVPTE